MQVGSLVWHPSELVHAGSRAGVLKASGVPRAQTPPGSGRHSQSSAGPRLWELWRFSEQRGGSQMQHLHHQWESLAQAVGTAC